MEKCITKGEKYQNSDFMWCDMKILLLQWNIAVAREKKMRKTTQRLSFCSNWLDQQILQVWSWDRAVLQLGEQTATKLMIPLVAVWQLRSMQRQDWDDFQDYVICRWHQISHCQNCEDKKWKVVWRMWEGYNLAIQCVWKAFVHHEEMTMEWNEMLPHLLLTWILWPVRDWY